MPNLRYRINKVSDRLSDLLSDGRGGLHLWHAAVAISLLVLVGTAVVIARGDASEHVAAEARVLSWAESVSSATAVLTGEVREGIVLSQSAERGVFEQSDVDRSVMRIDDAAAELQRRVVVLAGMVNDRAFESAAESIVAHTADVTASLGAGEPIPAVEQTQTRLAPAIEDLSIRTSAISQASADHIQAVTTGVGTITTAARFVSAFLIPILLVFILYRAMRKSKTTSILRSELARERELRHKKDAFIAAASHHIRTPLSSVVGFSQLLRDRSQTFSAGVRREVTELLAMEADETANVVDDLLAAARYDLGDLNLEDEDIDVRDLFDSATSDWEAKQRLKLVFSGNATTVGDRRWLTHAIRNLLRNAASFGGDTITVDIKSVMNRVLIDIADNGDPIPTDDRNRIFELYYSYRQVEGLAPSLGLGLSVARRVAKASGGDLDYYRTGNQNVFELKLPRATASYDAETLPDRTILPQQDFPGAQAIRQVIHTGGPDIVYQPIVALGDGPPAELRVVGYEALARFASGSPPQWFDTASKLDLRLDLELTCIKRAVAAFDPDESNAFLSVNVSDRTLLASRLGEAIQGIEPTRLILELSETASVKSYEETRRVVDALAARGIRLAVDDVGSNDIDLWHMTRLGAHMVKIDMSLVRELPDAPRSRALVRAVAAMADELGLLVVAEGVETIQEHAILRSLEVGYGQGYLYGRPAESTTGSTDARVDAYQAS